MSGVAVRVGRRVASLQPDLMTALLTMEEEIGIRCQPAGGVGIQLDQPAINPIRVELVLPAPVEPVAEVHPLSVAAHLYHLGTTLQRPRASNRLPAQDASDAN